MFHVSTPTRVAAGSNQQPTNTAGKKVGCARGAQHAACAPYVSARHSMRGPRSPRARLLSLALLRGSARLHYCDLPWASSPLSALSPPPLPAAKLGSSTVATAPPAAATTQHSGEQNHSQTTRLVLLFNLDQTTPRMVDCASSFRRSSPASSQPSHLGSAAIFFVGGEFRSRLLNKNCAQSQLNLPEPFPLSLSHLVRRKSSFSVVLGSGRLRLHVADPSPASPASFGVLDAAPHPLMLLLDQAAALPVHVSYEQQTQASSFLFLGRAARAEQCARPSLAATRARERR